MAVGVIATNLIDEVGNHLLEFGNKDLGIVLATFYFAKFLLPNTCKFCAFEKFFTNNANEFNACRSCDEVFAFLADVIALEQSFDDGRARTGPAVSRRPAAG